MFTALLVIYNPHSLRASGLTLKHQCPHLVLDSNIINPSAMLLNRMYVTSGIVKPFIFTCFYGCGKCILSSVTKW